MLLPDTLKLVSEAATRNKKKLSSQEIDFKIRTRSPVLGTEMIGLDSLATNSTMDGQWNED